MRLLRSFLLSGLIFCSFCSFAADPSVDVAVVADSSGPFQVGDRIPIHFEGLKEKVSKRIELVPLTEKNSLIDLGWGFVPGENGSGALVPLQTGDLTLPSVGIRIEGEKSWLGKTLVFTAKIEGEIPKKEKPNDLKPPERLGIPWEYWVGGTLGFLLLLGGLVFLGRWLFQLRKSKAGATPAKPELGEEEEALENLRQLSQSGMLARGQLKPFAYRASEILRRYLSRRYSFDAEELTSAELLDRMESILSEKKSVLNLLERYIDRLDYVKYTNDVPQPQELMQIADDLQAWVRMTRRISEVQV